MADPLVYVVVVTCNGKEHLGDCFGSLLAGSYSHCRFVLMDNDSHDGSPAFVRDSFGHDARVEVVECGENLGWCRAGNAGLRRALEAGADYALLLNDDTAVAEDAIARLVEAAQRQPATGALAPKMLFFADGQLLNSIGIECSIIGSAWDRAFGRLDAPRWDEERAVLGACGGACFLRADALSKAGLMPEDWGYYLDDVDLAMRIWDAGYEVRTCPEAVVRHKFSATFGGASVSRVKYYWNTRNRMRVILRNFPLSKAGRVLPALIEGEGRALGRALLDRAYGQFWAHLSAWASALLYVPQDLAERRRRRKQDMNKARFWPMVRRRPLFFEGVELPQNGWYAPREINGMILRPMARRATYKTGAARLRLNHANPFPHLGATDIHVMAGDQRIAVLSTDGRGEEVIDVPGAVVEFRAQRIFEAEDTGESVDVGGWIGIEPFGDDSGGME